MPWRRAPGVLTARYDRFLRANDAFDVVVINYEGDGSATYDLDEIAQLPHVTETARAAFEYVGIGGAGGTPGLAGYDDRIGTVINQFKVLDGRRADPDRADEIVVSFQVAEQSDLRPGSEVELVHPRLVEIIESNDAAALEAVYGEPVSSEEITGLQQFLREVPRGRLRVVGVVAAPGEVPPQYQGVFCCIHHTPTYAAVDRGRERGAHGAASWRRGRGARIPRHARGARRRVGASGHRPARTSPTVSSVRSACRSSPSGCWRDWWPQSAA